MISGLRTAGIVVAVEGAALVALSLALLVHGLTGHPDSPGLAVAAAVLGLFTGVILFVLARGVAQARRWARTPIVVLQLLALPVALALLQGGVYGYGVPLITFALGVLVLLARPQARAPFE